MMAEPTAPGRGLPVYQPATATMDKGGTSSSPSDFRPRYMSLVWTPISGMVSATGRETGPGCADGGGATIVLVGTGTAFTPSAGGRRAGVPCRVSRPAVPATATSRPAATNTAGLLERIFT